MDKTESRLSMDDAPLFDQIMYGLHLIRCEIETIEKQMAEYMLVKENIVKAIKDE